jgi:integral membrane sensor domain MASE1
MAFVLLDIPYAVLAPSLLIGPVLPAIVGAVLVAALEKKEILSEASEKS